MHSCATRSIPFNPNENKEDMKTPIGMALILAAGSAYANSACDRPHNDFDGLYCLNRVYQQADVDLNAAYKALDGKLDRTGRSALKAGEGQWMQQRNEQCSTRRDAAFLVDLQCATDTTIERTQLLQSRYRECVSSGCQNSKLTP